MSKRNKISLGTPTEELPEWTLSLDFTESQDTIKEEKKPESTISSESTFSEPSPQPAQPAVSGLSSGLSGGLNTEFVIGNDDSTSDDNSFSPLYSPPYYFQIRRSSRSYGVKKWRHLGINVSGRHN